MYNVLVTGGAGYIGSHTVIELINAGYRVVIADNLSTSGIESVNAVRRIAKQSVPFYKADILDEEEMSAILTTEKIDAVVHFAAYSQVGESTNDPLKYYKNNLCGTQSLLKAIVKSNVKYVVFSSTAATYGEPLRTPITEEAPTCPTNPYGETKLAMERMFHWTAKAYGLHYTALRYFNACGAHESGEIGEAHDPETHLVPIILQVANGKREKIGVYGNDYPTADGTCVRDYIHVTDLAKAHVLALKYMLCGGENDVFNLGNGEGFSVREMIGVARRVTGCPIPESNEPRRTGDPAVLVASSEKAKHVLGWKPQFTDPESIVKSAWNWHKKHPNGYKK